jgi:hypothetical protein
MSRREHRSRDPDIVASEAALRRAAKKALQMGLKMGTAVWVMKDGKIVDLTKERKERRKKQS